MELSKNCCGCGITMFFKSGKIEKEVGYDAGEPIKCQDEVKIYHKEQFDNGYVFYIVKTYERKIIFHETFFFQYIICPICNSKNNLDMTDTHTISNFFLDRNKKKFKIEKKLLSKNAHLLTKDGEKLMVCKFKGKLEEQGFYKHWENSYNNKPKVKKPKKGIFSRVFGG